MRLPTCKPGGGTAAAVVLLLGVLLGSGVHAYPDLFVRNRANGDCAAQPQLGQQFGSHGPVSQGDVTFVLADENTGAIRTTVCPGTTHTLTVNLGPDPQYLLATSSGSTMSDDNENQDPNCQTQGRIVVGQSSDLVSGPYRVVLSVGCDNVPVQVTVTTATGERAPHLQNTASFDIDPSCNACNGAAPQPVGTPTPTTVTTPAPDPNAMTNPPPDDGGNGGDGGDGTSMNPGATPNTNPDATPTPTATTTPAPAPAPAPVPAPQFSGEADILFLNALNSAPGCKAYDDNAGYNCNREDRAGWRVAYTVSTSPTPPDNACTRGAKPTTAVRQSASQGWIHIMASYQTTGWLAMAFADSPGKMFPASAYLAGTQDGTERQYTGTYQLSAYELPNKDQSTSSWALNQGAVQQTGRTYICFTREVVLPQAGGAPTGRRLSQVQTSTSAPLDFTKGTDLKINFASRPNDDLSIHSKTLGMDWNVQTGKVAFTDSPTKNYLRLHGAFMGLAFIFFLPTGMLFARYKRFFWKPVAGKAGWFWFHVICQSLGTLCFVVGFAIAVAKFPDDNIPSARGTHKAHRVIGFIITALVAIQVIVGVVRPSPYSKHRPQWNLVHHNLGRVLVVGAWINIALGVYIIDKLLRTPEEKVWEHWTVGIVIASGVTLAMAIAFAVVSHLKPAAAAPAKGMDQPGEVAHSSAAAAAPAPGYGGRQGYDTEVTVYDTQPLPAGIQGGGYAGRGALPKYNNDRRGQI